RPPGEVIDDLRAFERGRQVVLGEIDRQEREPLLLARPGEVALLGGARVVVRETVDADHVVAGCEEAVDEVRTDESSRSRDDHPHEVTLSSLKDDALRTMAE